MGEGERELYEYIAKYCAHTHVSKAMTYDTRQNKNRDKLRFCNKQKRHNKLLIVYIVTSYMSHKFRGNFTLYT